MMLDALLLATMMGFSVVLLVIVVLVNMLWCCWSLVWSFCFSSPDTDDDDESATNERCLLSVPPPSVPSTSAPLPSSSASKSPVSSTSFPKRVDHKISANAIQLHSASSYASMVLFGDAIVLADSFGPHVGCVNLLRHKPGVDIESFKHSWQLGLPLLSHPPDSASSVQRFRKKCRSHKSLDSIVALLPIKTRVGSFWTTRIKSF
jgi:hypothetical protein